MKPSREQHFPTLETEVLALWRSQNTFHKSVQQRDAKNAFVFYDGPPFATGLPHYGHLLAGTIKDTVARYWTMRGKRVERVFGWDCHGVPVEFEVEKSLNLSGAKEIEAYGIAKFNHVCRSIVDRYSKDWQASVERMGRWVDFAGGYKTMDRNFMESVWWVFQQLWDKGLIYEGKKIVRYSPRISTVLSNFEANLNYKTVQDPSVTVKFKLKNASNEFFLGWTTTPWTLISNLALSVSPSLNYVKVKDLANGDIYYLAESRLGSYYKKTEEYELLATLSGKDLEGKSYEPLFPYFASQPNAFKVLLGEHVTADTGTGIVHTAPAFGEEDFEVCLKYKIEPVDPIDQEGKFGASIPEYAGLFFKDADKPVLKALKDAGLLVRHDTIEHPYPFCYRSDAPLIYKLIPTWYVKVEALKEQLLKSNADVHWVPEHLKEGRFGKWLENARDWAISRNRYWGTPLPIFENSESGKRICVGSIAELEKLCGKTLPDIHREHIDPLRFSLPGEAGEYKQTGGVLDCWFESGSMPYAQHHYPFDHKALVEANFPADFIAEGLDQTRGWFYTLVVIGTALFGKSPFKNVVVNGIVLAEDGKKMSKRLKNYPDPEVVINAHGADALRLYMLNSPLLKAEDLSFSEAGVKDTVRAVLLPLWNAYSFFLTYALVDKWQPQKASASQHESDRWILSRLQTLIKTVNAEMEVYHLYEVVPSIVEFMDELNNWYIRRSRRRFWANGMGEDKQWAYQTLYTVLTTLLKVVAPFMPFMSENIYQNLVCSLDQTAPESVHLCDFPQVDEKMRDEALESRIGFIQQVVALGRTVRTAHDLKVRQPLSELTVIAHKPEAKKWLESMQLAVAEELNIKKILFSEKESDFVTFTAKANTKLLGPKLGQRVKDVAKFVQGLQSAQIAELLAGGGLSFEEIQLGLEDVLIYRDPKAGLAVETERGITVAINTQLTPELIQEGFAREVVSKVQNARKSAGLAVENRIHLSVSGDVELTQALEKFRDYIASEVLAEKLELGKASKLAYQETVNVNGKNCELSLEKIG